MILWHNFVKVFSLIMVIVQATLYIISGAFGSLNTVQSLLNEAREIVKSNVMTQEVMLDAAQSTKRKTWI